LGRLREAHRLYGAGQVAEAAEIFAHLGHTAEAHHMPRRAVRLHARAAESYAQAGNKGMALSEARQALQMVQRQQARGQLGRLLRRITEGFRQQGMQAEAETLEREFGGGVAVAEGAGEEMVAHGRLPAQCPQCGGPVRPDEVEWVDADRAECAYCGSILMAA
jgi:hypothetical protein